MPWIFAAWPLARLCKPKKKKRLKKKKVVVVVVVT
jgi:hypothetical protein